MNKYLEKIAAANPKSEESEAGRYALAAGVGGYGANLASSQYHRGNLTGRETLYHGTSEDRLRSIKEKGLQPNQGGGITGVVSNELEASNKPYTFSTKSKLQAAMYAAQQEAIGSGKIKDARDLASHRLTLAAKIPKYYFSGSKNIAKINLPTHLEQYKGHPNPEVPKAFADIDRNIFMGDSQKKMFKRQVQRELQDKVHVNMGAIGREYIQGSGAYKRNSASEILGYIKKNPGRFAKGLGKAGLGLGLVSGAAAIAKPSILDKYTQ